MYVYIANLFIYIGMTQLISFDLCIDTVWIMVKIYNAAYVFNSKFLARIVNYNHKGISTIHCSNNYRYVLAVIYGCLLCHL